MTAMDHQFPSWIVVNESTSISREQLNYLLETYNVFYENQKNLHILYGQTEDGQLIVEGMLDIFWGVKRPIQLKIQDEKQISSFDLLNTPETFSSKGRMTRWGEFDDLYRISELDRTHVLASEARHSPEDYLSYHSTLTPYADEEPESPLLYRTMSEAALIENSPRDFALYIIFGTGDMAGGRNQCMVNGNGNKNKSNPEMRNRFAHLEEGEQRKLKKTDVPLLQRLLQGPSKSNARIFLMDKDAEEISRDVAPYINFHFSFLESILQRLDEEEKMEIERIMAKFNTERAFILKCLQSKQAAKTETTV